MIYISLSGYVFENYDKTIYQLVIHFSLPICFEIFTDSNVHRSFLHTKSVHSGISWTYVITEPSWVSLYNRTSVPQDTLWESLGPGGLAKVLLECCRLACGVQWSREQERCTDHQIYPQTCIDNALLESVGSFPYRVPIATLVPSGKIKCMWWDPGSCRHVITYCLAFYRKFADNSCKKIVKCSLFCRLLCR